jgi:hypothetical protein
MDIIGNALFKNSIVAGVGTNLALGLGFLIVGPAVAAVAGSVLRPAAKTVIKGGMFVYDQAKTIIAETQEAIGDIVSESKAALSKEQSAPPAEEPKVSVDTATRGTAFAFEEEPPSKEDEPVRTRPWIVRGY